MNDKLRIDELKEYFKANSFTHEQLYSFYTIKEEGLKESAFRWRVHALKESQAIYGIKRGVYVVGKKTQYTPLLNQEIKTLYTKLSHKFPYTKMIIWETRWLHRFMIHQPLNYNTIVEIDKEATYSAFSFLQESMANVFLTPKKEEIEKYVIPSHKNLIIKNYLVENPSEKRQGIVVPKIEKIMVDLLIEESLYSAYQGKELHNIYKALFSEFAVNQSTLNRYATKRKAIERLQVFLLEHSEIDDNIISSDHKE